MTRTTLLASSNQNSGRLPGILFLLCCDGLLAAAAVPPNRIAQAIDSGQGVPLVHSVRRLALPQYDRGEVAANFQLPYMMLLLKPSAAQQSELDQLLKDQLNPSSPRFHRWLTPEQFGNRFGLNTSDHAKIAAWLKSEGFNLVESGRARNWLAFSGTAAQVRHTFHTSIHYYEISGEKHFANAMPVSIPDALSDIATAVAGLDDLNPKPGWVPADPPYTSGTSHSIAPEDFAILYDIAPIYNAGVNGAGINLGVIGISTILLTDIEQFRTRFNLPANDPKTVLVGSNPGVSAAWETEADLDLEWSGAVAPGAAITFYYSTNFFTAMTGAINANNVSG
jgi:subtilase family serine protease